MSAALKYPAPTSLEEFLAWERHQEIRYEWDGVQPIAMVGGTLRHSLIASQLESLLRAGLKGRPCTVFRSDAHIATAQRSRIRYPDVTVTCAPIPLDARAIPEPMILFEVLSESTEATDLGIKRAEYAALPWVQRYVVLSSDEALAFVFARGNAFRPEEVRDELRMPELDLSIPLGAVYEGLL
jgi:Uma2 family endonuclease